MSAYDLPTANNVGTPGHLSHHDALHGFVNQFDADVAPAHGDVLRYDADEGAYLPQPLVELGWVRASDHIGDAAGPDGTGDATAGIQAAIAAARAQNHGDTARGAVVLVPGGVWVISATIVVPDRVLLVGAGDRVTVLKATSAMADSYMVQLGEVGDQVVGPCAVQQLRLHGDGVSGISGVLALGVNEKSGVRDISVFNCGRYGIHVAGSPAGNPHSPKNYSLQNFDIQVRGSTVLTNDAVGLLIEGANGHAWRVSDFTITSTATGGPQGNGRFAAGIRLSGHSAQISHGHIENSVVGIEIGNLGAGREQCSVDRIIGHPEVDVLIEVLLNARGSAVMVSNIETNSPNDPGAVILRDHATPGGTRTITGPNLGLYVAGGTRQIVTTSSQVVSEFGMGGVSIPVINGTPADTDFGIGGINPVPDGALAVDRTTERLYVRVNGAWKSTQLT